MVTLHFNANRTTARKEGPGSQGEGILDRVFFCNSGANKERD